MKNVNFAAEGNLVRAKITVYDLPGNKDPGVIHAEPGELGIVVHKEEGDWPTIKFFRTGTYTMATDEEVEVIS